MLVTNLYVSDNGVGIARGSTIVYIYINHCQPIDHEV